MRKVNLLSTAIVLALSTQVAVAADYAYLIDPATMTVGQKIGENLIVKEGCSDPSKTTCQAVDKIKYITAVAGRTGRLEIPISISGDVDLSFNADFDESNNTERNITLQTTDGFSLTIAADVYANQYLTLKDSVAGVGGSKSCSIGGIWQSSFGVNDMRLTIQGSNAALSLNGSPCVQGYELSNISFTKVIFGNITEYDRLFETKSRGVSKTASCTGGSSTTTTVSGTTNTGDLPQISANMDISIPRGLYSQSAGIFTPAGSIPIWANLKYVPQGGQHFWTLTNAGVLP